MAPFTALATEVQQRIFKLAVSTSEASEVYAVTPDQMQRLAIGKAKHSQRYNTAMAILLVNKQFGSAVFVAIQQHCLEVSKELTRMNEWLPLAWIMLNKANSDLGQTILEMPELMQTGMLNATSAKRAGCFTPTQVERYEQVYRAWDSREKIVPMLRIRKWNLWYERDCEMSPLIEWFAGRVSESRGRRRNGSVFYC